MQRTDHRTRHRRRPATASLGLGVALVLLTAGVALALGGASTTTLGSGTAVVASCDADGFTVTHVLSGSLVTDVIVGDIHAGCAGGDLTVTLTDLAGTVIGSGGPSIVPGGGGSVSVAVTPTPDQADIDKHRMLVVGP